jgi:hypothetical protein
MDIFDNKIECLLIDLTIFVKIMSEHLDINHSIWAFSRGNNLINNVRTELVKKEIYLLLPNLPEEIINEIISFI